MNSILPVNRGIALLVRLSAGLILLALLGSPGQAGNTHSGTGDAATEGRAWWGDVGTGYVVQHCLHDPSGTTSAAIPVCRAYALNTEVPRQLEYIEELTSRTLTYSAGAGTYWLIAHAETTEPVTGWTRSGITHYLWLKATTQPPLPSRATWLARVTVTGSAITNVLDLRSSNPLSPNLLRATDPIWNAIPGDGLNDQQALQGLFAAAKRGYVDIEIPPGIYDVDGDAIDPPATNTAITLSGVQHVRLRGYGATLRAGPSTVRLLGIYNSSHWTVEGMHVIGHTQIISEHKHAIVVGHGSHHGTIRHNYCTNFFGDCLYIGGNLADGSLTGFTSSNIKVYQNTFKERQGNGTSSFLGGTKSRLTIGIVDAHAVQVFQNFLYGVVDLEPDVNNQRLSYISFTDNTFLSGPVTAQTTIGTAYHHDEPLLMPGASGTIILGGIVLNGATGGPLIEEVSFTNNSFDRGLINCSVDPYICSIVGNRFNEGLIIVSALGGVGSVSFAHVVGNQTRFAFPGETTFIRLDGLVTFGTFANNSANIANGYVIDNVGAGSGDGGRNVFVNNFNRSATAAGMFGMALLPTSVAGNNYFNQGVTHDHLTTLREAFIQPINLLPSATPPPTPSLGALYTDSSGALCWFNGSAWVVVAGGGSCS